MRKLKFIALAGIGAVVVTALSAAPALAEGTLNQKFTQKAPGFNSASWQDSHLDHKSTTVTFSSCTYYYSGGLVKSAEVTLYDEYGLLPDQAVGEKSTVCGSMNFGEMTRSDEYHWNLLGLDESTSYVHQLSATSAVAF